MEKGGKAFIGATNIELFFYRVQMDEFHVGRNVGRARGDPFKSSD